MPDNSSRDRRPTLVDMSFGRGPVAGASTSLLRRDDLLNVAFGGVEELLGLRTVDCEHGITSLDWVSSPLATPHGSPGFFPERDCRRAAIRDMRL